MAEGDYRKALGAVETRVSVMPSNTDQYFSWNDSEVEMKYLKRGEFAPIENITGCKKIAIEQIINSCYMVADQGASFNPCDIRQSVVF